MSVKVQLIDYKVVLAVAGVAVVGLWYAKRQATKAFEAAVDTGGDVLESINPTNNDNVFSRASDSVVSTLSGGRFRDLADVAIYLFNDEPEQR